MSENTFKLARAITLAGGGLRAHALAIVGLAIVLIAAPIAGRLYNQPKPTMPTVSMHVDLPPARQPAKAQDHQPATRLEPIRMNLDATPLIWWAAGTPLGVLFDGFVILCMIDHSTKEARSNVTRIQAALRHFWVLLLIDLFSVAAVMAASFLLIFPAIFAVAGLAAAKPLRLVEGLGPMAAVARSVRLGWGSFWKMSLASTAYVVVNAGMAVGPWGDDPHADLTTRTATIILPALAAAVIRAVSVAMSASLYIELTRPELGVAITQLETVFS